MAEEVVIRIDAQDAASGKLRQIMGALDQTGEGVEELDRQSKKASQGTESFGASMFKATLGAEAVMEAARLAASAIVSLGREMAAMVTDTARAGTEALNLSRSLGVSVEEVQALQYAFEAFGADGSDIADVFNTLTDRAEDAKAGMQSFQDDFALIGLSVDDLRGKQPAQLFDTFVQSLSEMEDVNRRNTAAVRILGDDVGNKLLPLLSQGEEGLEKFKQEARDLGLVMSEEAAQDAFAFERSMARLSGMFEGFRRTVGAGVMPVITAVIDAFRKVIGPVDMSTESIRNMTFNAVDKAMGSFIRLLQVLDDLSPIITGVITYAKNLAQVWKINFNIIQAVGKTIMGALVVALSEALGAIEALIGGTARVAEALDLDMAKGIRNAEQSLGGFRKEMDKFADASFDSAGEDIGDIDDALGNIAQNIKDMPGVDASISQGLQDLIQKTRQAREEVAKARMAGPEERPTPTPTPTPDTPDGDAGDAKDAADEEIKRLDAAAELEAKMAGREAIAQKELQAMRTQDEIARARLQHEARMLELAQQDLTVSEQKMRQLESERQMRQEIEEAKKNATQEEIEGLRNTAKALQGVNNEVVQSVGNAVNVFADMKEGSASAGEAVAAGLGAAGTAATTFADELGASAAAQAGIMAIFETAMGFATLSNPPVSAGHFLAAANFGLIAGKKAAKGGGGGGGGGGSDISTRDVRDANARAAKESAKTLAEALGREDIEEGGSVTNIYDFSGSTMLESAPATQNRISEANERGRQRTVRAGGRG